MLFKKINQKLSGYVSEIIVKNIDDIEELFPNKGEKVRLYIKKFYKLIAVYLVIFLKNINRGDRMASYEKREIHGAIVYH